MGYIKDYDGGTLMECAISKAVDYLCVSEMVAAQRAAILDALRAVSREDVVYAGLTFPPPAAGVGAGAGAAAGAGAGKGAGSATSFSTAAGRTAGASSTSIVIVVMIWHVRGR